MPCSIKISQGIRNQWRRDAVASVRGPYERQPLSRCLCAHLHHDSQAILRSPNSTAAVQFLKLLPFWPLLQQAYFIPSRALARLPRLRARITLQLLTSSPVVPHRHQGRGEICERFDNSENSCSDTSTSGWTRPATRRGSVQQQQQR